MAYDQNVQYLSLAFWQIIMTAGPILAIALGIGLLIGLIQAATSIQEMTLSFVPKLFVVLAAMAHHHADDSITFTLIALILLLISYFFGKEVRPMYV